MLAQQDVTSLAPVLIWFTAVAAAFGPGARSITWVVDRVRDAVSFGDDPKFKLLWPLLALAIALFACLMFPATNVVGGLFAQLPRFEGSTGLMGTAGQIITAFGLAGFASTWHDRDVAKNPPVS
jgi:ABC-type transport system involved in cytochrome c biogenesis permease subunit